MAYSIGVSINNGTGNASITGLAITGIVLAYYVGKYIVAKIEQQDDEYYSVAKNRFQENYPLFTLDEKIGNIVITVVTNSADYISGDLQLGTKTLVKIGNGYIWLDNQTGGNLEEILDGVAIVGAVAGTAKTAISVGKAASKVDDAAKVSAGNISNSVVHGDSNCYDGPCWLYIINNKPNNTPYNVGETGGLLCTVDGCIAWTVWGYNNMIYRITMRVLWGNNCIICQCRLLQNDQLRQ